MIMTILISSAGRRVALADCFRESLRDLSITGSVMAIDAMLESAAGQLADTFVQVPRCTEPSFLDTVIAICERENVQLLVPTIDTELPIYAAARERFARAGVVVGVSDPRTVAICEDKTKTHTWLTNNGFPTARQSTLAGILADPSGWSFPLIAKPRVGSASVGVIKAESLAQLESIGPREEMIVEEMATGDEYTINVYVSQDGLCISSVPHRRMEVRSGEVSKGITCKHPRLIEIGYAVSERLPGAWGPLNIQCFLNDAGDLRIIEINARFGGGYPLAHRAGATITSWLIQEALGFPVNKRYEGWEDGLVMLRYDEAVFRSYRLINNVQDVPDIAPRMAV
jgi:carbamoyl-phosphate synthase large subunit